jgi:hypothetical protein
VGAGGQAVLHAALLFVVDANRFQQRVTGGIDVRRCDFN